MQDSDWGTERIRAGKMHTENVHNTTSSIANIPSTILIMPSGMELISSQARARLEVFTNKKKRITSSPDTKEQTKPVISEKLSARHLRMEAMIQNKISLLKHQGPSQIKAENRTHDQDNPFSDNKSQDPRVHQFPSRTKLWEKFASDKKMASLKKNPSAPVYDVRPEAIHEYTSLTKNHFIKNGDIDPKLSPAPSPSIGEIIRHTKANSKATRALNLEKPIGNDRGEHYFSISHKESAEEGSAIMSSRAAHNNIKKSYLENLASAQKAKQASTVLLDKSPANSVTELRDPTYNSVGLRNNSAAIIQMNTVMKKWRELFPEMFTFINQNLKSSPDGVDRLRELKQAFTNSFVIEKSKKDSIDLEDSEKKMAYLFSENVCLMEGIQEVIETGLLKMYKNMQEEDQVKNMFAGFSNNPLS